MKKHLFVLLALAFPSSGAGQAILNVEALQRREDERVHAEVSGRLRLASGNTELFQIGGDLGLGFLGERHWVRGYAGMERLEQKGKDILNNRYMHLRYNYRFADRVRTFHFVQLQANENLFLDRRFLLGSGLRARVLGGSESRLEVGTGLMLEAERLNEGKLSPGEDPSTRTVRMANLLVGSGPLGEENQWVTVVYYQPNVEAFEDYRLSGELGLKVQLVSSLQLDVSFNWRHDHRAPEGLEENDLGLRTGFTYHIR
jgi:putative salt-induced outer membrane protein YdiY